MLKKPGIGEQILLLAILIFLLFKILSFILALISVITILGIYFWYALDSIFDMSHFREDHGHENATYQKLFHSVEKIFLSIFCNYTTI